LTTELNLDRRALLAGLAALTAPTAVLAKGGPDFAAINAFMDKFVGAGLLANCVVAITRPGRETAYISRGTLALDSQTKAGPDSIYRVYSMSKPITGATFMTLVEKNQLTLDTPITAVLPEFKDQRVMIGGVLENTRPAKSPILMRHLVTHTSGLSYGIDQGPLADAYNAYGLGAGGRLVAAGLVKPTDKFPPARDLETFGRRLATMPLDFDPGTKWQYSVGLDLMGLIIQRVSGMGFYDYMRQVILDPLDMKDTDFVVPKSKQNRLTSVYTGASGKLVVNDDRNDSPFSRDRDLPSGGGGLTSTARDYARFTAMLANEGSFGKTRVLKAESVRTARTNQMDPGIDLKGTFAGAGNGFGVAMQVLGQANPTTGEPAGVYGWDGAAGTTMWVDPVSKASVVGMIQIRGGPTNIHQPLRVAAYQDMKKQPAAVKADAATVSLRRLS
jgi:CubicO group peptidase (beta-lactamase class C family)